MSCVYGVVFNVHICKFMNISKRTKPGGEKFVVFILFYFNFDRNFDGTG